MKVERTAQCSGCCFALPFAAFSNVFTAADAVPLWAFLMCKINGGPDSAVVASYLDHN